MSGETCRVVVTSKGLVVPASEQHCRRAIQERLKFYMTPDGKCYLPYDVAVKLGLCKPEESNTETANTTKQGHQMRQVSPAIRFMEILDGLRSKGRNTRHVTLTISEECFEAVNDLSTRLKRPRSQVAEALLRLALEAIGFPVGVEKPRGAEGVKITFG